MDPAIVVVVVGTVKLALVRSPSRLKKADDPLPRPPVNDTVPVERLE